MITSSQILGIQQPQPRTDRRARLLLPAQFINCLGNGIQLTASALLLVRAVHTTLSVGWLFVAVAAPQVVLSMFFGSLVDRHSRRLICVICSLISAMLAAALPIWRLLDGDCGTAPYIVNLLLAAVTALYVPASNALLKERVAPTQLGLFNANYEMCTQAGTLLSTALGGILVQVVGTNPLFFFNSATFVAAGGILLALGRTGPPPDTGS